MTGKAEVVFKKAEEDVVAIILLAIVGSIINRWEAPTSNRQSEICCQCKEIEANEAIVCSHTEDQQNKTVKSLDSQVNRKTSFQELSSQFFTNQTASYNSANDTEVPTSDISFGSIASRSEGLHLQDDIGSFKSSKLSTREGTINQPLTQLSFKTLLENDKDSIYGWDFLEMDTEVNIEFKEGNRYEGKLFNCQMNGHGKFFWADGSLYEGDFLQGEMTGKGCLEWPDQSWYEGEMLRGHRHGQGLYVQKGRFYCGEWACGQRHGRGSMYYERKSTKRDFYDGEWHRDYKQGWGVRSYPNGAVYSGQWLADRRNGLGTMVWTNNDVYMGNWKESQMNGYGEYTWSSFFNNQLAVPQENCFYGNWENGFRNGNGTLETSLGVIVRGTWKEGKKSGPAEVICSSGFIVYADKLFEEDCISQVPFTSTHRASITTKPQHHGLYKVPVNDANHNIDFSFYTDRLYSYMADNRHLGKSFGLALSSKQVSSCRTMSKRDFSSRRSLNPYSSKPASIIENETEESLLRKMILRYLSALKMIYLKYSEICCKVKPNFNTVLLRLMLWQFMRDCNLHKKGISLSDFDILFANNKATLVQGVHYPFERLQFWQFLHCLIEISWELYGKHCSGTPNFQGVLASGFHRLITTDVLPNVGWHKGSALLKHKDFLSLDAVYWFYRGLGEPLSARKLLKKIFISSEGSFYQHQARDYPLHLLHGKNLIGVGGKLTYYPETKPFMPEAKWAADSSHPQDLTCLSSVGLLAVFDCLLQICPSIADKGLIINMDYMLVFLEFYEFLLLCTNLCVEKKNEESKLMEQKSISNILPTEPDTVTEELSVKQKSTLERKTGKKASPKKKKKK